ncbi:RICIN domain-containing protein [Kitasatospora sp. NPDC053057]|uniref:RICIN domain-containing protein n=1 Tax=Kitasatospora sp. NPDC053057 TaxID=3364062 RepID=UPI0037C9E4DC
MTAVKVSDAESCSRQDMGWMRADAETTQSAKMASEHQNWVSVAGFDPSHRLSRFSFPWDVQRERGRDADGTSVQVWSCTGNANQVWQPSGGGYRNPASGRFLDDPGFSATDGTQVQLGDYTGGANQQWTALTTG